MKQFHYAAFIFNISNQNRHQQTIVSNLINQNPGCGAHPCSLWPFAAGCDQRLGNAGDGQSVKKNVENGLSFVPLQISASLQVHDNPEKLNDGGVYTTN